MPTKLLLIVLLTHSLTAIKVPVHENTDEAIEKTKVTARNPIIYSFDDGTVDSYLIPPHPYLSELQVDEVSNTKDKVSVPSTYLLPPHSDASSFYVPTESAVQSDWYPIIQRIPNPKPSDYLLQHKTLPIKALLDGANIETDDINGKNQPTPIGIPISVPSRQLQPPKSAPIANFHTTPATDFQLPLLERNIKFRPHKINEVLNKVEPTLSFDLTPPNQLISKYKNPTKLYPKKYSNVFQPTPIPVAQFVDANQDLPLAKPVKSFKPINVEEYSTPSNEKKKYQYEQAELKRELRDEDTKRQDFVDSGVNLTIPKESEQKAEETSFYDESEAPERQSAPVSEDEEAPAPLERTEFRMHGLRGPNSYQFGYDTGKGKNRQFRYEERDNDGFVRGHYGYVDKNGKLQVVNYDAHPEEGFHAEGPVAKT